MTKEISAEAHDIAERVEKFIRDEIFVFEKDKRCEDHGPTDELVQEMRVLARAAGVLTPHIREDGSHLTHLETALVLRKSGLSPLGPLAVNTFAPDEGNSRVFYLNGEMNTCARCRNGPASSIVFPVSAAILERIDDYRIVLENHSAKALPLIEWHATPKNNVEVTN